MPSVEARSLRRYVVIFTLDDVIRPRGESLDCQSDWGNSLRIATARTLKLASVSHPHRDTCTYVFFARAPRVTCLSPAGVSWQTRAPTARRPPSVYFIRISQASQLSVGSDLAGRHPEEGRRTERLQITITCALFSAPRRNYIFPSGTCAPSRILCVRNETVRD